MGTPYEGGYLWPPRPTVAAAREFFPDGPFAGQAKMNGRCVVVAWDGKSIVVYTRHNTVSRWAAPVGLVERLRTTFGDEPAALSAELMHSKGILNTIFVFDVLAFGGERLDGWVFEDRMRKMRELFPGGTEEPTHRDLGGGLWIARTFVNNLGEKYDEFVEFDHVEGLVLKRLGSTLSNMAREGLDGRWQLKVRKPSSKYRF